MKKFEDSLCFILAWILTLSLVALYMATIWTTFDVLIGIIFREITLKMFIKWIILASVSVLSLHRIIRLYKTEMEKERKDEE